MSVNKDGGPAFPQHGWSQDLKVLERMKTQGGMSLRDWFAGQALAGLIVGVNEPNAPNIAPMCYAMADAMLAEREKEVA